MSKRSSAKALSLLSPWACLTLQGN